MKTLDDISQTLSEKNIKPSYNRIRVMEYLLAKKNHPTAEEIYRYW
jgi:Fur family peroxide stress response transcriptional regulator